jgi:hypothetical protein
MPPLRTTGQRFRTFWFPVFHSEYCAWKLKPVSITTVSVVFKADGNALKIRVEA